jgi:serine/threonine-protein kinase 11
MSRLTIQPFKNFKLRYKYLRKIDQTKNSEVYLYVNKETGKFKIGKIIRISKKISKRSILNEIKLQNMIKHTNIMRIDEVYAKKKTYCLMMEYSDIGDLVTLITNIKLTNYQKKDIFFQLTTTLSLLHAYGMTHSDIKPSNCIMFKEGDRYILKLSDFGFAHFGTIKARQGTITYISPEQLSSYPTKDIKTDLWSLGVTLYNVYSYKLLFSIRTTEENLFKLIRKGLFYKKGLNNDILLDLICKLLVVDKEKRLSAIEVLNHTYFDEINQKNKQLLKYVQSMNLF